MKKLLSLLLSAIMLASVVTAVPFSALAVYELEPSGDVGTLHYTFNSSTGVLTLSGNGELPDSEFYYQDDIKSVIIGDGVTSIGSDAFYNCPNLSSVTIGSGVKTIGSYAFRGTGLTSVYIPSNVTDIKYNAFYDCTSLRSATICGAYSIGSSAFEGCSSLSTVTLQEGTKLIDEWAFCNCYSLEEIVIPDSVTTLSYLAFDGCSMLKKVTFGTGVTTIPAGIFGGEKFQNLKTIIIPEGVKVIGNSAFYGTGVESITIPASVTKIEWSAFGYCSALTSVKILGATYLDDSAFECCGRLSSVDLGDKVTHIGYNCFYHCYSLKNITLPRSLATIHDTAFEDNSVTIKYMGTKADWAAISDINYGLCRYNIVICTNGVAGPNAVKTCKLEKTSYVYSGSNIKPGVSVIKADESALSASYYTVTYPSDTKSVGTHTVKVTFKGAYAGEGTKSLTYVINPKATTISSVKSPKSKKVTVKWKKASNISGYELQLATNSAFTQGKKSYNVGASSTSATKSGLKKGKKYFVRIRTYKTVNGKKYYSSWSAKKTVKVK